MARDPLASVSTIATPETRDADQERPWCIYALADPQTGAVFYIGKTARRRARIREHLNDRTNSQKAQRIRALRRSGLTPAVLVLEEGTGNWGEAERRWIAEYRATGAALTNQTDGGEGLRGVFPSTRQKISIAQRARWGGDRRNQYLEIARRPERRLAIAQALKGRRKPPEHVAKLPQNQRGYNWAPEILERRRAALLTRAMPIARLMARSPAQLENLKRMQEGNRGRVGWARGRTLSEEERATRSAALTGRPKTPEHKECIRQGALRRWERARAMTNVEQLTLDDAG